MYYYLRQQIQINAYNDLKDFSKTCIDYIVLRHTSAIVNVLPEASRKRAHKNITDCLRLILEDTLLLHQDENDYENGDQG